MAETKRERLSVSEKDLARFLVWGVSNKEIARVLGVDVVTVRKQVGALIRKFAVRNRAQPLWLWGINTILKEREGL